MSKELSKTYDPKDIEDRLYKKWEDNGYFHAEVDRSKKPFTIVMPPPNITGQLHMGHALDNTMQDILIRYKRMQGYNALWQPGIIQRAGRSNCRHRLVPGKLAHHYDVRRIKEQLQNSGQHQRHGKKQNFPQQRPITHIDLKRAFQNDSSPIFHL